jgi:hypothetical protein
MDEIGGDWDVRGNVENGEGEECMKPLFFAGGRG